MQRVLVIGIPGAGKSTFTRAVAARTGMPVIDLAPGCPEKFDLEFLRYIWDFNAKSRPQILTMLAQHGQQIEPVVLRRDRDVARFLDGMRMS